MFGHDDDKKKARRPLPQGILSRTMPPHKPRDNKAVEDAAKAKAEANARANAEGFNQNAYAFGQNSHLHANGLPMRPSSSHAVQPPSALAPAQGYHSRSPSYGGAKQPQRDLPSAFGFKPPSTPSHEAKKAPYPISMYGNDAQPEPKPATFGLLSSSTVQPAYHRAPSPAPNQASPYVNDPRDDFEPATMHPRAALYSGNIHQKPHRTPSPVYTNQHYPPTPPHQRQDDNYMPLHGREPSMAVAAQSLSAFNHNYASGQTHTALAPSEIRLIRIPPFTSGPLKIFFTHVPISKTPPYIALSYTWGSTKQKVSIEVNGNIFHVTRSLYEALRKLQSRDHEVVCWADALSINQVDRNEVSSQIQMMGSIYSFATSVAMWLGPASRDSDVALELIDKLAKHDAARNDGVVRGLITSTKNHEGFRAIISLFEREYWRRLWVVQEVIKAKTITVHCGPATIPWKSFLGASNVFHRYQDLINGRYSSWQASNDGQNFVSSEDRISFAQVLLTLGPATFEHIPRLPTRGGKVSPEKSAQLLLNMLCVCRTKFASDARDKVYGLLGLLPDHVQADIIPDYDLSVKDLFCKTADYIITTSRRLDVICAAMHYPVPINSMGLPSWVPDWSNSTPTKPIDWPIGRFTAGGSSLKDVAIIDETLLRTAAVYLDKVQNRGTPLTSMSTVHDVIMAFLHWFSLLQARAKTSTKEQFEKMEDDFCRILVLDNAHPYFPEPHMWRHATYHIFASLAADLIPEMPLHPRLVPYSHQGAVDLVELDRNYLVQELFVPRITGRSFFITERGLMGMGSGYLATGDLVTVPYGCSTPVLLRTQGNDGQYRLVGDAYVEDFMYGRAVDECHKGRARANRYDIV